MEFHTVFIHRPDISVLVAPCDLQPGSVASRILDLSRSARDAGLCPTRQPFVQLYGAFAAVVNVPVAVVPEECGLESAHLAAGWAAVTDGVPLEEARAVAREVRLAMADFWTPGGPAEFHPGVPGEGYGAVVIPVLPAVERPDHPLPGTAARQLVTAIPGA